jgi:hypothetical protein
VVARGSRPDEPRGGPLRPPLLLAMVLVAATVACGSESARLTGDWLVVDPCLDGAPRNFQPVKLSFDHLVWVRNSDANAFLEARRGWRDATHSDELVVQFLDLPAVRESFRTAPGTSLPFDGIVRVTLALGESCPDSLQPLVALTGTLALDDFELGQGGRVSGTVRFDLRDLRADATAEPAGRNLVLTFDKDLNDKDPLTGYGR